MGFDARSVAPLSYDFTAFPPDGADDPSQRCSGKGLIPEPSKAKIEAFFKAAGDMFTAPPVTEEDAAGVEDQVYQMLADVCSGKPSVDELRQLPPRILTQFGAWLLGELAPKA